MSPKMAFSGCKIQMLITFLLVGGLEKFKVLQKAYFEYMKKLNRVSLLNKAIFRPN